MTPEKRKQARLAKLLPEYESFYTWIAEKQSGALPGYALYKALNYALKQKPFVMNVFKDGRLECTNNRAERQIRPFAIARRNFLFSDTPNGAVASAALFSIVQTALANNLKPFEYLTWVLERLPHEDLENHPELIECYLPWSDSVPKEFQMTKDEASALRKEPVLLPPGSNIEELERAVRLAEDEIDTPINRN